MSISRAELDGARGDISVSNSGATWSIANSSVTNEKVSTGIDAAKIGDGSVSNAEFQYLSNVTSDIQTQLDAKSPVSAYWGNGVEGAIVFSGNTTLSQDRYATNITVNNGVVVTLAGYRLFATGTLTNNGTIQSRGGNGTNGASAGTAGNAGGQAASAYVGGGAAAGGGGAGGTTTGTQAGAVTALANGYGGTGGAGGAGGNGTSGNGGASRAGGTITALRRKYFIDVHTLVGATLVSGGGGGAGGSGGGGDSTAGGGGGGGLVFLVYSSINNTGSITAAGGALGTGSAGFGTGTSGSNGVNGNAGIVVRYNTTTGVFE